MSGIEPWTVPDTSIENATAAQSAALAQAIPLVVREGLSAGGASAEIAGAIAHLLGRRAARTDQALRLIDPATAPEEFAKGMPLLIVTLVASNISGIFAADREWVEALRAADEALAGNG